MARYASFGEALKEARIRKGIEPQVAARRLRIRTDILQAIEASDFAYLPAKGYCKSMISAYARMVGLNSEEIVRQYLEEAYSFEVGRVRESSRYEPRSMRESNQNRRRPNESSATLSHKRLHDEQPSRGGRVRMVDDRYARISQEPPYRSERSSRSRGGSVNNFDGRSGSSRRAQENAGRRSSRHPENQQRSQEGRRSGGLPALALPSRSSSGAKSGQAVGHPRQSRSSLPTPSSHYSSLVSSPARNNQPSKLPFLAAGLVLLLVLVLVAVLVFGGKKDESAEDLPNVPISGLTDTSTPTDPEADSSVPTPPTSAEFSYKVPEGQSAYIEVYVNGSDSPSEASTVEGSSSKRYEVTGTLKFVTTNPDGVSIAVNGETVKPTDNGGNGIYTYVVDFSSILATWEEENKPTAEPDTPDDSGSAPSSETGSPE